MTGVLVVDDSQFMRTVIAGILTDHGYEVGTASDGQEAIELVEATAPDVVTMDVEMPGMDGVEATERIMTEHPTPVVMVSAHTETGSKTTLQALARGAVDFVAKPGPDEEMDVDALAADLLPTVEAASGATVSAIDTDQIPGNRSHSNDDRSPSVGDDGSESPDPDPEPSVDPAGDVPPTVVVGASTGGPHVVERILASLPADLGARVLVVQHMPDTFTGRFATRLDDISEYEVTEATDRRRVAPGEAVVAKGDYHMRVAREVESDLQLRLDRDERLHSVRPAIDVTMRSVAETVTGPLVGVVLTGMGSDGAGGLEAIAAAGGATIVQDPDCCPVAGMPEAAIATGCVDYRLTDEAIPGTIYDVLTREARRTEAHV